MNPDYYPEPLFNGSTTWTLKDSQGNVVTFKVRNRNTAPQVEVTDEYGKVGNYLTVAARNIWNEYIRCGFVVYEKRNTIGQPSYEKSDLKNEIEAAMEEYEKTHIENPHHFIDLQEMRIGTKGYYDQKNKTIKA